MQIKKGTMNKILSFLLVFAMAFSAFMVAPTTAAAVAGPVTLETEAMDPALAGDPYNFDFGASGGSGSYDWIIDGLPSGLGFDSVTGNVYGTPTTVGNYTVSAVVYDAADSDNWDEAEFDLVVFNALEITDDGLKNAIKGRNYSDTLVTSGGIGSLNWIISGLPSGLNYNSVTGEVYGKASRVGKYTVTAAVYDSVYDVTNSVYNYDELTFEFRVRSSSSGGGGVFVPTPEQPEVNFSDINGHWAEAVIKEMANMGILNGYPDGSFRPDGDITRAEFAQVIFKAFELDTGDYSSTFTDIAGHWAENSIETVAHFGIVSGYNASTFGPDDKINREQMTNMLARAMELTGLSGNTTFVDDADISAWAKPLVKASQEEELVIGYPDNSFRPQGNSTRAEAVQVIYNAIIK